MSTDNLQKTSQILRGSKAALHNLGCKVNAYETEAMRELLVEAGCEIVDFTEFADIYVVNTCTVTAIADKKSRQMLRRVRRINPEAVIVCAGCFAEGVKERVKDEVEINSLADIWLGNRQKGKLVDLVADALDNANKGGQSVHREVFCDMDVGTNGYENMRISSDMEHTRAFVKIQDGCDRFCSYCRIPYVRGRSVSRDTDDIALEVQTLANAGFSEIVLTGIHVSSYEGGLIRLIDVIHETSGIDRIRLSSLEPTVVTDDFAREIKAYDKVCPHFHLSLQSGCDETLKRMNRRYTTDDYANSVSRLRAVYDNPAIMCDVIAGFPGETEDEFAETISFVKKMEFAEMHVFPFSAREGTRAYEFPNQLPHRTKQERTTRLLKLSDEMRNSYIRKKQDCECEVLFEDSETIDGVIYLVGYTREYIKVAIPMDKASAKGIKSGDIVKGTLGEDYDICK